MLILANWSDAHSDAPISVFHIFQKILPDMTGIVSTWQSLSKKEKAEGDDKKAKGEEKAELTEEKKEQPGSNLHLFYSIRISPINECGLLSLD